MQTKKTCPYCQFQNLSNAAVCRFCGRQLISNTRRTFGFIQLAGIGFLLFAVMLSVSSGPTSLHIRITQTSLIFAVPGVVAFVIGVIGRFLFE